jgi:hypothetical protein
VPCRTCFAHTRRRSSRADHTGHDWHDLANR